MDLQAEKNELLKMLIDTDDKSLIKDIRSLFTRKTQDDTPPQFVLDGIRKSQEQFKGGQWISYDEVKKQLDKI